MVSGAWPQGLALLQMSIFSAQLLQHQALGRRIPTGKMISASEDTMLESLDGLSDQAFEYEARNESTLASTDMLHPDEAQTGSVLSVQHLQAAEEDDLTLNQTALLEQRSQVSVGGLAKGLADTNQTRHLDHVNQSSRARLTELTAEASHTARTGRPNLTAPNGLAELSSEAAHSEQLKQAALRHAGLASHIAEIRAAVLQGDRGRLFGFGMCLSLCLCCVCCVAAEYACRKQDQLRNEQLQADSREKLEAKGVKGVLEKAHENTGSDSYHFGDFTRGLVAHGKEARGGSQNAKYKFGDMTRGLVHSFSK